MTDIAVLNHAEQVALDECERVIGDGIKTFVAVGSALAFVRENNLYRGTHKTFEIYARERWNLSRPRAYELMTAAEVVSAIADTGQPAPENEGQARQLAKVPEPERADVWRETVERTEGKPTAAAVRAVHNERTQTPGPPDSAITPPVDPGTTEATPASASAGAPAANGESPGSFAAPGAGADLEAELAADSARRAQIRNLTSVLTYLVPRAITPAELAERSYAPVLDEFKQDELDRAAETMTAIAELKRGL